METMKLDVSPEVVEALRTVLGVSAMGKEERREARRAARQTLRVWLGEIGHAPPRVLEDVQKEDSLKTSLFPWRWSRPYEGNRNNGVRIEDANGSVVLTGFCHSDKDMELIVDSVNFAKQLTQTKPLCPGCGCDTRIFGCFCITD